MRKSTFYRLALGLVVCGIGLMSPNASALIVQDSSPAPAPSGIPTDAIGTWGGNAGAVAVAPGWVLTTRHQNNLSSPSDQKVTIDGTTYDTDVSQQVLFGANIDLRLVPIFEEGTNTAANLSTHLEAYTGSITGATVVLAGFGPTIGAFNTDGYDWAGSSDNSNGLNVGQNRVDSVGTLGGGTYAGMDVLLADFDDITQGGNLSVDYEATAGIGDSGGVFLINDGGVWKIAGLLHAVDISPGVADAQFGQQIQAADVRGFASTINTIPEPTSVLVIAAGGLVLLARGRRASR